MEVIQAKGKLFDSGTSQDREFEAAVEGIVYCDQTLGRCHITVLTDSTLVAGALVGEYTVAKPLHQHCVELVQSIQGIGPSKNVYTIHQVLREYNPGADRVCNLTMDLKDDHVWKPSRKDLDSLFIDGTVTRGRCDLGFSDASKSTDDCRKDIYRSLYYEVMLELGIVMELRFNQTYVPTPPPYGAHRLIDTEAGAAATGFETLLAEEPSCRMISDQAFCRIKQRCLEFNIRCPNHAFRRDTTDPTDDVRILSQLTERLDHNVEALIDLFRDQPNSRPNPHLRPTLYRQYLSNYAAIDAICEIAENGFTPRLPIHSSPNDRYRQITSRLSKGRLKRRAVILEATVAEKDSRVASSPFGVVEKKGVDYTSDGRLIHNLKQPQGNAVNEAVPLEKLDASTDRLEALAGRILECYRLYPGKEIMGLTADVDAAFQNIPSSSPGALLFGGLIPGTTWIAIALSAVFGFKDSPGLFALFAKATQFYQRSGSSIIDRIHTPLHCWLWVDDFVLIEPNVGSRLTTAEKRIRQAFHLIFGTPGWNDKKFQTWNSNLHAVGLDWDLAAGTVSIPPEKVSKAMGKTIAVRDLITNSQPISLKVWRSLVGSLRHVSSCIPAAKALFQSFVSVETACVLIRIWVGLLGFYPNSTSTASHWNSLHDPEHSQYSWIFLPALPTPPPVVRLQEPFSCLRCGYVHSTSRPTPMDPFHAFRVLWSFIVKHKMWLGAVGIGQSLIIRYAAQDGIPPSNM